MNAETYEQLVHATSQANRTLELVAHLASANGDGFAFAEAVRAVAWQLEEAQSAVDDYMEGLNGN